MAGQAVMLLMTPFLTRVYSPQELGTFAVFAAITAIFAPVFAGHFELAIPLPKNDSQAVLVVFAALATAVAFAGFTFILIALFSNLLFDLFQVQVIANYWPLIPLFLVLYSANQTLTLWSLRNKQFVRTAAARIAAPTGQVLPQIGMGMLGAGPIGLLVGLLSGQVAAALVVFNKRLLRVAREIGRKKIKRVALAMWRYRRFPMFAIWSTFVNTATAQAPLLILAAAFDARIVGLFALSFRVVQAPVRFIGQSVAQVILSEAGEAHRDGSLNVICQKALVAITSFGIPSFVFLTLCGEELFAIAFGSDWIDAGGYAAILSPWMFATLLSSSVSVVIGVLQKQKQELIFQIVYAVVAFVGMILASKTESAMNTLLTISVIGTMAMMGRVLWLMNLVGVGLRNTLSIFAKEVAVGLCMILLFSVISMYVESASNVILSMFGVLLGIHAWNIWVRRVYLL